MIYCRTCGDEQPHLPPELMPFQGYECGKCTRLRLHLPEPDDDDLPDTDVLEGDDPDEYFNVPG